MFRMRTGYGTRRCLSSGRRAPARHGPGHLPLAPAGRRAGGRGGPAGAHYAGGVEINEECAWTGRGEPLSVPPSVLCHACSCGRHLLLRTDGFACESLRFLQRSWRVARQRPSSRERAEGTAGLRPEASGSNGRPSMASCIGRRYSKCSRIGRTLPPQWEQEESLSARSGRRAP